MLNENGAQLSTPDRLRVDTNAIGLGTNAEIIRRYVARGGCDAGSTIMIVAVGRQREARDNDSPWHSV
ncbi:MAG: hypothetical protein L3J78_01660 [Thermoplasmata archaeon]|nr:hypothetical protein [Thermoplasmata archaeon]